MLNKIHISYYSSFHLSCHVFSFMGLSCLFYVLLLEVLFCRLALCLLHFLHCGIYEESWAIVVILFLPFLSIHIVVVSCSSILFFFSTYPWQQLSWNLLLSGMFEVAIKNQCNVINYYITSPYSSNNVWNEYSYSTISYDNYL